MLKIELKFDYYSKVAYIPDGYIRSVVKLQMNFFRWVYQQPECMIRDSANRLVCSCNEMDFIRYMNDVVLKDSLDKAYLEDLKRGDKRLKKIIF